MMSPFVVKDPVACFHRRPDGMRRGSRCGLCIGLCLMIAATCAIASGAAEMKSADNGSGGAKGVLKAYLVPIPLPITGTVDTQTKQRIDQILVEMPKGEPRPILVLEYRARPNESGEASEFERCLSLARYLANERLKGVRAVSYLPQSVKGHAVLPVIAAEQIMIHPDAELGEAGVAESVIPLLMRRAYSEIADWRRIIPAAVVLGMLDKELAVYRVQTVGGPARYVLEEELEELKKGGGISSVESIVRAGDFARFTGRDLRLKYGFADHLARDRNELAAALQVPAAAIEDDPSLGGRWLPVRVDLQGPISGQLVNWVERSIRERLGKGAANLLCVHLDSPGGSAADSLRLANYLASLDASQVRTVAFVPREARADAAIIAIACDHLVMSDRAVLGGPGALDVASQELPELRRALQVMATEKARGWSLPAALIDLKLSVHRYTHAGTGEVRYFCAEELGTQAEPTAWTRGEEVDVRSGLSGREAENMRLARYLAADFEEFKQMYHLTDEPDALRPSWAHLLVERMASPQIAAILIFVAWFALFLEFSQPGLGLAGFISATCFVLYFWSQFLHGTAGWLEILLFVAGVSSVLVEIFVVPGFGVFGLGGGLMIIASMILASQTFVIPRNAYQFEQMPRSLSMVAAAGAGVFVSLVVMRRYLSDVPVLKRLVLATPSEVERRERAGREVVVDFSHLRGKRGKTTTQLTPSGKARFGDELVDVMSDGEVIPFGVDIVATEVLGNAIYVQRVEQAGG